MLKIRHKNYEIFMLNYKTKPLEKGKKMNKITENQNEARTKIFLYFHLQDFSSHIKCLKY